MLRNLVLCKAPLLLLIASVATAAAQTPVEINFGVISTEASTNQKKNWEPFLQAIAKSTGFKVNGFYATDYAGVIEAMRFNTSGGLVRQQIRHGSRRSCRRRSVRPTRLPRRQHRVLLPCHRPPRQSAHDARRHSQMRQVAGFRYRRP